MCRNPALINKVATSMLNMYNVYFKEIFDCLIDEILLEEVIINYIILDCLFE